MHLHPIYVLFLFLSVCGGVLSQSKGQANVDFCILADKSSQNAVTSLYPDAKGIGVFQQEQAISLIQALPDLVKVAGERRVAEDGGDLDKVKTGIAAAAYDFQLIGFDLGGRKHVLINALDKSRPFPNWREIYQPVHDGGPSYWFCVCDLDRKAIILVSINGRG
jgi:hypothetical protein